MSTKLFDEIERHDYEVAEYSEPAFVYWNRTARCEFDRARCETEKWFTHYPPSGQEELRTRFRSDLDPQHEAAFFELFLHELLLKLGCQVSLHPSLLGTTKTPDFVAESPSGDRFYVEATIATGESLADAAARARENTVYDVLNRRVQSPDYFLWLNVDGAPGTPPPARKIARFVQAHLDELDYDEISRLAESGNDDKIPRWRFEHAGWKIEFQPLPKKPGARGKSGVRPIGGQMTGMRRFTGDETIRRAISEKAGRYGELDLPYVIAVNVLEFIDQDDVMAALFGPVQYTVMLSQDGLPNPAENHMSRFPDGVWVSPKGPQNTRISAVLLATRLSIFTLVRAKSRLYHNPWAQIPYGSVLTRLPQAAPKGNQMKLIGGESLQAIFGLPSAWPEGS